MPEAAAALCLIADELRSMAAAARRFSRDPHELERADRTMAAAARIAELVSDDPRIEAEFLTRGWDRLSPGLGAACFVLDGQGQILLGRRSDNAHWCLPGGLVEVGESPSVAAVRELWEEVGVRGEVTQLIGVFNGPDWGTRSAMHFVHLEYLVQVDDLSPSAGTEMTEVGFFSPDALPEPMHPGHRERIGRGMECLATGTAHFDPASSDEIELSDHQRR